jgi:dephospho-CoA kinase
MIIGVSGTNASGKDELAEYLRDKHGFLLFHTSDYIREVALEYYGNILRPTLIKTANELRVKNGAGVLAKMGIQKFNDKNDKYPGVVISSLRAIGEADEIHNAGGRLIYLDSDRVTRYKRLFARGREDDNIDFDTFVKEEEMELSNKDDPSKQSILDMKERADICIENDGTLEEFYEKIVKALSLPVNSK